MQIDLYDGGNEKEIAFMERSQIDVDSSQILSIFYKFEFNVSHHEMTLLKHRSSPNTF